MADNAVVEYLRERNDVKLSDFTRDGYRTLFVHVMDDVEDELMDLAEGEGYEHLGSARNLDSDVVVEVFSVDENYSLSRLYRWV